MATGQNCGAALAQACAARAIMKSDGFGWPAAAKNHGGYGGVPQAGRRAAAPREDTMKLARLLSSAVTLAASVAAVTAGLRPAACTNSGLDEGAGSLIMNWFRLHNS